MTTNKQALQILESKLGEMTFGLFARASRNMLGLSQAEMARKLDLAKGTLCDIEKGRQFVSPKLARKIAKKSGISEVLAIQLCLQDQLRRAKIDLKVLVSA